MRVDCDGFYRYENYDGHTRARRRWRTLIDVLRRIPPEGYEQLVRQAGQFFLFVPHDYCLGMVRPFPADYSPPGEGPAVARVVYLAPALEDEPDEIRGAVIAHELAHVALEPQPTGPREGQEDEVLRALCGWGFREKAEAHQELRRERRRRVERGQNP
jgi:hypothetical protein